MDHVRRAEETLVGTIVLEPRQLDEVAGWLAPADFGSPACRLLYQRLLDGRRLGDELGAAGLLERLREHGELRSDGYPIAALTGWLDGAPARPHAAAYAAVVLEGALGRQVEAAGVRLVQAASELRPARALVAAVTQRSVLVAAQRRWGALPAAARTAVRTAGAAELVAVRGGPTCRRGSEVGHAELVTVGSVLVAPHLSGRVRWLEPEDFAAPDLALAFSTAREMSAAGVPVDRVTLAAELHRRGAVPAAGQWAVLLARAEAAVPVAGSVGFYGRQVLDASVVAQVAAAGRCLIGLGRSCRGGAPVMLGAAIGELDALRGVQQRLRRSRLATAAPPVRAAEPSTMSRAAASQALQRSIG